MVRKTRYFLIRGFAFIYGGSVTLSVLKEEREGKILKKNYFTEFLF